MLRAAMFSLLLLGQHVWLSVLCAGCIPASESCCALPAADDTAACCCPAETPSDAPERSRPASPEDQFPRAPFGAPPCPLMPAGSSCAPVCCVIPPQSPASMAEASRLAPDQDLDSTTPLPARRDPLIALRPLAPGHAREGPLDLPARTRRALLCVRTI